MGLFFDEKNTRTESVGLKLQYPKATPLALPKFFDFFYRGSDARSQPRVKALQRRNVGNRRKIIWSHGSGERCLKVFRCYRSSPLISFLPHVPALERLHAGL